MRLIYLTSEPALAWGAGGGYVPPESEPKVVAEDKDTDYVCCELFNATNPPPKVRRLTTHDTLKLLSRCVWTSAATCCAPPSAVQMALGLAVSCDAAARPGLASTLPRRRAEP